MNCCHFFSILSNSVRNTVVLVSLVSSYTVCTWKLNWSNQGLSIFNFTDIILLSKLFIVMYAHTTSLPLCQYLVWSHLKNIFVKLMHVLNCISLVMGEVEHSSFCFFKMSPAYFSIALFSLSHLSLPLGS